MTKTRQKLHFALLPQNCTPSFHTSCIIFQRPQSSRSRFFLFFSNIFCPKLPQLRAFHLIFSCFLFYCLFWFSATCLSVIALALSVRPVFPLKPWQRWHLPSQDLDPMGLVSDNLQTPGHASRTPSWLQFGLFANSARL